MDEQRMQAYVTLIKQILSCEDGKETALLQANAKLVDAGLVEVMGLVAMHLESERNSNAGWLRQFAGQLTKEMGMAMELESEEAAGTESTAQFLLETLQLVAESQGNPEQVYPIWAQQQGRLNPDLLEVLPSMVENLFAGEIAQRISVASVLGAFGNLINQFPLGTQWVNLELGIVVYEQLLQVYTRDAFPEEWATTQNNLAIAYKKRLRGERADNIEQAIEFYNQALRVRTRDAFPAEWAATQNNLALAYSDRIRGERADNLEYAVALCEKVLQVYTRDGFSTEWAATQNNLALVYADRIRGERADNLEQAINFYNQALQVRTRDAFPTEWAATQNNLALVYADRIRGERADNLEQAIAAYEEALQVYTRDAFPKDWAMAQNNMAIVYSNRIRGEQADNIEQAITLYKQALKVRTYDTFPENWATTQNNLANAYLKRGQSKQAENVERAIMAYEKALQIITCDTFPENWAMTQNNLAIAYSNRIEGQQADNIEKAITAYKKALQVYTYKTFPERWATTQNNLANIYFERVVGNRADNIKQAITAYEKALQVFDSEAFPNDCRRTARNLGNIHFERKVWAKAAKAYATALIAAEILYQACIFLDGKAAELADTAELPRCIAYALTRVGHYQTAVEVLEQGRARGLSETLYRDRANLDSLQQKNLYLYHKYKDLTNQLRDLEAQQRDLMTSEDRHSLTPKVLRDTAIGLRQQLTTTIDQIRQEPGYETFLALPTYEDVRQASTSKRPLVYLLPTPAGSLALIVTPDTTDHLWLDNFTDTHLTNLRRTWFSAYDNVQSDRQAWYDTIEKTTQKLWEPIMGPLVRKLQELGCDRITLIPTGLLSLLPLHAAWTEDKSKPAKRRYAFDDIHITYAPNAKSLTAAQFIADRVQANSILAINNPSQDLDNSEREVQAAISSFLPHATILRHHHATTTAVKTALPQAAIAHFSCHGTANLTEPLTSGLAMSDGLLTLKDIFALNLAESGGLRLAILSACETGIQGLENADEAVSLPTGLLQAGVAAVIASLWSVDDRSTRILLTRFYDLWRKEHLEPSVALRQAQLWVRDTSSQQKAKYFQETNPDLFQSLILLPPDYFAHPFHWAAFSYTGV